MTIIYLKLKYCGYAYALFERVLGENQFVGNTTEPTGRLFAQFHPPQTDRMKKELISEIKKGFKGEGFICNCGIWNGSRCTICKERRQHNSTTQYRSLYARNGKSRLNR